MKEKLRNVLSLSADQATDRDIYERIRDNGRVSGSNMYILIFAILIASIGLNMNSTAVVIGAMLISPVMGVIIKFAYSISIQDFAMMKNSFCDFLFQLGVSIVTSTAYFLISPLNDFSGELAARTNPTLWDALIAFFGGFAAVIASTRKDKVSNVIPGAAIATALMPPLCTAGYCLASSMWVPALYAFYLFFINTIFICFSSILGFYIMHVSGQKRLAGTRKKRMILAAVIVVALIPSAILAWQSVDRDSFKNKCEEFIEKEIAFEGTDIVKMDISTDDERMDIFLIGNVIDDSDIEAAQEKLPGYGLEDYELNIIQSRIDAGVSREELDEVLEEKEMELSGLPGDDHSRKILELQSEYSSKQAEASEDLILLYPQIESAGFADIRDRDGKVSFTLILTVEEKLTAEEKASITRWIEERFEKKVHLLEIEK